MDRLALVQFALRTLGDVSASVLSAYIQATHGVRIEPKYIPVFKATLQDRLRPTRGPAPPPPPVREVAAPAPPRAEKEGKLSPRAQAARQEALQLMAAHGLTGWTFRFNRGKQILGLCVYHRKCIELSIHYVERDNPAEDIRDTILHEIAHALVGPRHGHDAVWKRKCVEIGARPTRCGTANMPEGRWQARCGGCGRKFHRHRKPKDGRGWHCRACGPDRGKLAWQEAPAAA